MAEPKYNIYDDEELYGLWKQKYHPGWYLNNLDQNDRMFEQYMRYLDEKVYLKDDIYINLLRKRKNGNEN